MKSLTIFRAAFAVGLMVVSTTLLWSEGHLTAGGEVLGLYSGSDGAGAALGANLSYRRPLFERDHPLLAPSHVELGLSNRWAPVFNDLVGYVVVEPLAVFDLRVSAGYQSQFTELVGSGFYEVASYNEDPATRVEDQYGTGSGTVLRIAPRFKIAAAGFAIAHTIQFSFVNYANVGSQDRAFYLDTAGGIDEILAEQDRWTRNETYVLYSVSDALRLGVSRMGDYVPSANRRNVMYSAVALYDQALTNEWQLSVTGLAGTYTQHRWLAYEPNITVIVGVSRTIRS